MRNTSRNAFRHTVGTGLPTFFPPPLTGAALGSTNGIPKRAARALRFSSSISSTVSSLDAAGVGSGCEVAFVVVVV